MFYWYRKLKDLATFGMPYMLKEYSNGGSISVPDAFILRIRTPVYGSISIPDKEGELVAFGNACTHMGCHLITGSSGDQNSIHYKEPAPNSSQKVVCGPCVCHGTTFDLTKAGLVILGPASQHLPQLALEISGDEVIARNWLQEDVDPRQEQWQMSAMGAQ